MAKTSSSEEKFLPSKDTANALFRQSFPAFLRKVFPWLHSGAPLDENWHLDATAFALQKVYHGDIRRLAINLPPRGLKTFMVSIAWPLWQIGRDPSRQILVVSHTMKLSQDILSKFRILLGQPGLAEIFPNLKNALHKDTEDTVRLVQGGAITAVSVESNVTGIGGDLIIVDDPLDASDALSETTVASVNHWFDTTLSTRLNNPATDPIVLVMQRLAVNDLSAHVAGQGGWTHLVLPVVAETDGTFRTGPDDVWQRKKGDLLHPTRYPPDYLQEQRKKMGKDAFQAQFQQAPVPIGGGTIDISRFGHFTALPAAIDYRFLSIDAASGVEAGSYSVIQVWAVSDGCLYLTGQRRGYLSFPELKQAVVAIAKKVAARYILVEYASAGQALADELKAYYFEQEAFDVVVPIKPMRSKEIRMARALICIEAGRVLLPKEASFRPGLIAELQAFPAGEHDDQVDALSQAVNWYRARTDLAPTSRVTFLRRGPGLGIDLG